MLKIISLAILVATSLISISIIVLTIPKNSLEVENQTLQTSFTIKKLVLTKPGFITIMAANQYHKISNVFAGRYPHRLSPGTYSNLVIFKQENRAKEEKATSTSEEPSNGYTYFALVYEDTDGNSVLSGSDRIMTDWMGRELIARFRAHPR